MSYKDKMRDEIGAILDRLMDSGESWDATWIAHEVCGQHEDGIVQGDAGLFWRHCGYVETRRCVTASINHRAGDHPDQAEAQYVLPGYEQLQSYYVVKRDGVSLGVSVYDMTPAEVEEKIHLYRAMGAACYAHADELDRFQRLRPASRHTG